MGADIAAEKDTFFLQFRARFGPRTVISNLWITVGCKELLICLMKYVHWHVLEKKDTFFPKDIWISLCIGKVYMVIAPYYHDYLVLGCKN